MVKNVLFWSERFYSDHVIPIRRAAAGCAAANDVVAWGIRLDVCVDGLTPCARFIAEHTRSTLRSGSILKATLRQSEKDLLLKVGRSMAYVRRVEAAYGSLDELAEREVDFDILRAGVTGEAFFEGVARRLEQQAVMICMDRDGYASMINKEVFICTGEQP